MSIITFWNDNREQTGQTFATIAIATRMAIECNIKILLIATSLNDSTIKKAYWGEDTKNSNLFAAKNSMLAVENDVEGLLKLVASNKLTPSIITDYTKVVFKGRLEVITGYTTLSRNKQDELNELRKIENNYIDLIRTANQYYDMVIVDLDKGMNEKIKEDILKLSDINVFVLSQNRESINRYNEIKRKKDEFERLKCIPVIGKYIKQYKYNSKNIARYLQEKQELDLLPFNLLYMEAVEEAKVVDLFLKLKNIKDKTDENYIFMQCTLDLTNNILKRLQDMQMRMR